MNGELHAPLGVDSFVAADKAIGIRVPKELHLALQEVEKRLKQHRRKLSRNIICERALSEALGSLQQYCDQLDKGSEQAK